MKAAFYQHYGGPERIRIADLPKPLLARGEVLVRVHAASINSWDWDLLTGNVMGRLGGLFRPRRQVLGADIAGVVETAGEGVARLARGDAVVGDISEHGWGGFAEYVSVPEAALVPKPDGISFEEAAAVSQAGTLALQALRLRRSPGSGARVLIVGAGGGCGSFAIQLARLSGAHVTAVDSGAKLAFMSSLGADRVIDYMQEDAFAGSAAYDCILDPVARRPLSDYRRSLAADGTLVVIGGTVRTLVPVALAMMRRKTGGQELRLLIWRPVTEDIAELLGLAAAGTIRVAVDRVYPLADIAEAMRRVGEGCSLGKVVVRVTA